MSKPGRNEPCHCGSGKKYKKCCLEKDGPIATATSITDKKVTEIWEPEDEELNSTVEETVYDDFEENEDTEYDEDNIEEDEEEDDYENDDDSNAAGLAEINSKEDTITNKPYPVISADDEKLIDEWWDGFDNLTEPAGRKKHIENFMYEHPQLAEHMSLEDEVLFELGDDYRQSGKIDEYIHFLLNLRKEFPDAYVRGAGIYDREIIAWLITQNREDEIENYFGYLKEYPVDFVDELFMVVDLLEATNNTVPLISLASATFERVTTSEKVLNGNGILTPLVAETMSKYLQDGFTDKDVVDFLGELAGVIAPVKIDISEMVIKHWSKTFHNILRPFECWSADIPKKRSQMEAKYQAIGDNFRRYLQERTGISWISASYYSNQIIDYFGEYMRLANGKVKKQFDFSEQNIDSIAGFLSQNILWMNCTRALSIIQAVHHFAAYLRECGNITEQEMLTIQGNCKKLYDKTYPGFKNQFTEAGCFKTFPFI